MRNEVDDLIEKAKKKGGPKWEKLKGAIKFTGEKGFDACFAGVSKEHGKESAEKICGALRREAKKTGLLKPKHMKRLEKKEYLKGKRSNGKRIHV